MRITRKNIKHKRNNKMKKTMKVHKRHSINKNSKNKKTKRGGGVAQSTMTEDAEDFQYETLTNEDIKDIEKLKKEEEKKNRLP